jgi:transcriptional regulator with XRE-family HTH domain
VHDRIDERLRARHDALERRRRTMTRLASILEARNITYTAVAERARLQPRTIRQIATGETSIDNVAVGTVRRIASALSVPMAELLEPELPFPGDASLSPGARLSMAIREVMWSDTAAPYPSPVERGEPDEIAARPGDDFFADMPVIDARRG